MTISFLPEAEQSPLWEGIRKLLEPAAQIGGIKPKDELDLIWIAHEGGTVWAAFTVALMGERLDIACAGGTRLKDWLEPFEATMTAFGLSCGAKELALTGRKGWGRWAKRFGWKLDGELNGKPVYVKDLNNGR